MNCVLDHYYCAHIRRNRAERPPGHISVERSPRSKLSLLCHLYMMNGRITRNKYISPDVVVDFTSFSIKELSKDKVEISSVKGYEATDTYKVSINYFNGYKASGHLTISGPNALEKSELTAKIIWKRLKNAGISFEDTLTEYLGFSSCHGTKISEFKTQNNEIVLRLSVRDKDRNKIIRFGKELAPVITAGPPGITGFSGGRPRPQEIIAFWPCLIDKK